VVKKVPLSTSGQKVFEFKTLVRLLPNAGVRWWTWWLTPIIPVTRRKEDCGSRLVGVNLLGDFENPKGLEM
jgi:hypothetical protein